MVSGGRSGRAIRGAAWRRCRCASPSRARVSRAAFAVGASTEHGTALHAAGRRRRRRACVVLPAPAGPTTSTSRSCRRPPRAASACITSSPSAVDRWWTVAGGRSGRRSPRRGSCSSCGEDGLGGEVAWRSVRSTPTGHPNGAVCRARSGRDRRSVRARGRRRVPARSAQSAPPIAGTRGAACRTDACSTSSACHRRRSVSSADTASPPRPTSTRRLVRGAGGGDVGRRAIERSSRPLRLRSATVSRRSAAPWPDLRLRVSADASRVSAARSHAGRVPAFAVAELVELAASAASTCGGRLENTRQQLGGACRRSRPGR